MNNYKQIIKKENYNKLLNSGMFFEFYPDLKGNWQEDSKIILPPPTPKPLENIKTNALISICKDPITDDGTKKSLKGKCAVFLDETGEYMVQTECTDQLEESGELQVIYEDGKFLNQTTLEEIRNRLK